MYRAILLTLVFATSAFGDVRGCGCDASKPETMEAVNCSLCREAEKQPMDQGVFFLKDANPRKANRTLALPRRHTNGPHSLNDLTPTERKELFAAAIAKGKELWGDNWGVAYNGVEARTQCHAHVHIGKLIDDAETGVDFAVVASPEEIQIPADGNGIWIHQGDGKIHVHSAGQINETVLLR